MCVVSMIGDHYSKKWQEPVPYSPSWTEIVKHPTSKEFEALKKEVEEMKELLKKAVEYDKRTGQEHCENEDKLALLRKIAEAMGVKLDV